ncbi:MAG: hypothetical protein ACJAT4_000764 [Granulosicoccus sp.]|jgi:hypothetical protein
MKDLRKLMKLALLLAVSFSISNTSTGQCTTWKDLEAGSVEKEAAEANYQIYKDHLKEKNYPASMIAWEKLMAIAPAADGKRISPFWDGIKLLKEANKKETDVAKIAANNARIVALHEQCIECLQTKKIIIRSAKTAEALKAKVADQMARQAEDMFKLKMPAADVYAVAKEAVETGGKDITYKALHPYAASAVTLYKAETIPAEEARNVHDLLNEVADDNTIKQEELAVKYSADKNTKKEKRARQISKLYTKYKIRMNKEFKKVESEIFDCEYFKGIYMSDYEEGKDDVTIVKTVYSRLKKRKCTDEDPFIMELKEQYKVLAAAANTMAQDSFNANNPAVVAKNRYDAGDYTIAIEKWEEAIAAEADPNKQATYLFRIASTQGRKLKQYTKARTTARKAAKTRPNWGRPFMLIGDLYASSARRCGDDWNQRLAILAAIDKYSYAKSIDPEVADEARKRIGKYNQSRPEKAEGFSRSIKEGASASVGCWIGETVKVRFK